MTNITFLTPKKVKKDWKKSGKLQKGILHSPFISGVLNSPPSVFLFPKEKDTKWFTPTKWGVSYKMLGFPNWPMGFVLLNMMIFGGPVLGVPPRWRQVMGLGQEGFGLAHRDAGHVSVSSWCFCWGVGKRRWNWGGGLCGWIYHKVRERVREKTSKGVRECWKYPIDIQ